jgi:hypothetical protein
MNADTGRALTTNRGATRRSVGELGEPVDEPIHV